MKFSEAWLREWVNPPISREELAAQVTMAGLEVDAVELVAGIFSGVVVAEVLKVEPHPDADKLRVCQVNPGTGETLQIVCGAANVREGLRVPAALVGAVLPGDFKIKRAKLRGVESLGMLCSASELGLAESSSGLMELPADAPVGRDFREYLQLDDASIELGLTPNRGDCLSIAGVAREVAVLNKLEMTPVDTAAVAPAIDETREVRVEAAADCPLYIGRVVRGIDSAAETPLWMSERLRRCGLRSLGAVVDVTNYVLLELGQPMHAFDLAKLSGAVIVRKARAGERLALLNDTEVELDDDALVIADEATPLALAGIMGGAASAVGEGTTDVFLEAAFFSPERLAGRARRFGLHTDSSHRFERGVSAELPRQAMERATALLIAIAGGKPGPVVEQVAEGELPARPSIALRYARIERVLGAVIAREEVAGILTRLGMGVIDTAEGWNVVPPAFRFDVTIEEDLIEEVARIYGYNNIETRAPQAALEMHPASETLVSRRVLAQTLVEREYQEAVTYSFVEPRLQQLIDPELAPLMLANPISQDMSAMRTSLWPGLVQTLTANLARQQDRVRLFEVGLTFRPGADGLEQTRRLGGLIFGTVEPEQWGSAARKVDFFDLKGDVEALLALGGEPAAYEFRPDTHPALHPGQSAAIYRDGQRVGWLGALHPSLERPLDVPGRCYVFELDMAVITCRTVAKFAEISKFPAIRRDIAIVVDRSVSADQVLAVVRASAPEFMTNLKLFDVYQGEHIDSGRKSIALGLTLQAQSRTLKDEDVDTAVTNILGRLKEELGAALRD